MRIGVIGAGARGRQLTSQVFDVRDQDYFLSEKGHYGSTPHQEYDRYADRPPEWLEDVRDLTPRVTAVVDPDEEARRTAVDRCEERGDDPTAFASFETFLEDGEYDAVVLASPNDSHLDPAIELLGRDVDILCEKPVATTLEDHDRLIAAESESRADCVVGFNLRSSPLYSKLAALIEEGAIGDLGMITAHNVRVPLPDGFRYERARSGGTLLEKNCHDFDLFNWYADADPLRVCAFGGQHVLSTNTDIGDHATVIVEYENGVKGTLELCLYAPYSHRGHRSYAVRGSDGILQQPLDSEELHHFTYSERTSTTVGEKSRGRWGHGGADIQEVKTFLEVVHGTGEKPATLLDAKKAAAVAIAGQESIERNEVVEITPEYDLRR